MSFKITLHDDERNKSVFHNTTPDLQDQLTKIKTKTTVCKTKTKTEFFGLRPVLSYDRWFQTTSLAIEAATISLLHVCLSRVNKILLTYLLTYNMPPPRASGT